MKLLLHAVLGLAVLGGGSALAQTSPDVPTPQSEGRQEPLPAELQDVGIVQMPGAKIPLDAAFVDDEGRPVTLGDYFHKGKPVVIDLGYYRCPMLCNLVLNGMVEGLKDMSFVPGRDFEIVVVSIDPLETPELAKAKKQNYLESYGRPGTGNGWHFLTGGEANIEKVAKAVGFRYRFDKETHQYAHGAALFVATPEGEVSRVLTGITYAGRSIRLALTEASAGKIGSPVDQVLLFCFHFDAATGKYTLAATRLMKAGGALSALVLAAFLTSFWVREHRRRKAAPEATA